MTQILKGNWHGFSAVLLENEVLRVAVVPELGAKIVSMLDKSHNYEWLVPPMRPLRKVGYGVDFVSQDMSGWDEMIPTIVACTVDGVSYPDHGEVWGIPWEIQKEGEGELVFSVRGVAWPYIFTRSVRLSAEDCLELGYTIRNEGTSPFPYLWAAHPQFRADAHTRIILPGAVKQLVNVVDQDPAWGARGEIHPWPAATGRDGAERRLDRVRPVDDHSCRKFYVPPDYPIEWAALVHEEHGCQLRLSWSMHDAPYFGLWVDEGTYNVLPAVALEPSNGYYDGLDKAIQNGRVAVLEPGTERRWNLQVHFGAME